MKKQGDLYLKIVSIVLAGIVVAYLVLSVLFGSGGSSYTLETAVRCEAGDGQTVSSQSGTGMYSIQSNQGF